MAEITAALVKELRDKTGGGMMDCKKALTETGGDLDAAVDWLRQKGLAAAEKKSGRVAAEGLIALHAAAGRGAMIELNAETDFVARNERFQAMARTVAEIADQADGDFAAIMAADYPGTGRTVGAEITNAIATIGENMTLRRVVAMTVSPGVVASYMHNAVAPGLGKIGVIVAVKSAADEAPLAALGKQLAMHIAAVNPQAVAPADLDPALVERERKVLVEQARASGKPDEIVHKMVEGRLRKFYQEVALLEQTYVIDGERTVAAAVADAAKELAATIEITGFARFALGEGVERQDNDFAAEVAATAAG